VPSSESLRILLVADADSQAHQLSGVMAASTTPRFEVFNASNGWEAQRQSTVGEYEALVIDCALSDTDCETLLERLKSLGVRAPALVLTAPGWDQRSAHGDEQLPMLEGLTGNSLVRTIVGMVRHHDLSTQLAEARSQAAQAQTALSGLVHDLATPLGVVMGLTQVLLSEENGLNIDGRECLADVAGEAMRATEILQRCQPVDAVRTPVQPGVPNVGRAASEPGGTMVLIADDDPATRRLVCATLASDRYSVLQAADGEEAWRLIREHHPAVAILDWQMPVYSGLELTDVIKGDPQIRGMTVIMLTGRSAEADRAAGARAHADLFLVKPFLPQDLLTAVERALGLS
jgi:DNA-binding response OmpR family regulator